jgi:hypothetical protein
LFIFFTFDKIKTSFKTSCLQNDFQNLLKLSSHPINLWFRNYLTRLRISIEHQSQVEIGRVKIGHGYGYLRVKLGQDQSIQGSDKDWIRAFESWIKFGVFEDLGRIEFRSIRFEATKNSPFCYVFQQCFFFFYKNKTVIWLDFFIFSNAHNCNWIFELVRSLFMLSKVAGYCHILQLGHHAFVSKEELTS